MGLYSALRHRLDVAVVQGSKQQFLAIMPPGPTHFSGVHSTGTGVKRKYRLIKSTDFKRVRRLGKSYAHPLVVLVKHPNASGQTHIGISAGRSVGNAVRRNRAKRLLREIIRPMHPAISPGWDIILLARRPLLSKDFQQIEMAVLNLLKRAGLVEHLDTEDKLFG